MSKSDQTHSLKQGGIAKGFLNGLLSVILVVGLMPSLAFAAPETAAEADGITAQSTLGALDASAAITSQMASPTAAALNASDANVGTAANPYDILIAQGAFCAPSKFWGNGGSDIPDMVLTFRQTDTNMSDGTTLFSYTFDTSKRDTSFMDNTWTNAFRFSPYTAYDTSTGVLRIGTASKGSFSSYFPTFQYKVNVAELTKNLDSSAKLTAGDTAVVTYYGAYDANQTSRGTNYTVDLSTTDAATTYSKSFVVDEDGFITIDPLPTGGNYTITKSSSVTYKQSDGYEAYTGWQGEPWPGGSDSSSGGTSRKGWPSISLTSPLSLGVADYVDSALTWGTEVTVVTDMNATDTSIAEPTTTNPWYYKNIILPSYDVSADTISFGFNGQAPGGISTSMATSIAIATSADPTTWGTYGEEGSTLVWQATTSDLSIAAAGSNWWKRGTITVPTTNLQANQTYYLVFRAGMTMGNVTSYANIVFEFNTNTNREDSWDGVTTAAQYFGQQGTGTNKVGFITPSVSDITTDLTSVPACYYNTAKKTIDLTKTTTGEGDSATTTTQATLAVHADGSGSNWTNIAGWQDLTGSAAPNVNVYSTNPYKDGIFSTEGLTPVCSAADGTLTFSLVNADRDWPTRDGVNINALGLEYDTTYYLVFNASFAPNNMGALGTPIVLQFTTSEEVPDYTVADYAPGFKKVTYTAAVAEGMVVTLNGQQMAYDGTSYVAALSTADAAALTAGSFAQVAGTAETFKASGDVNQNGKLNIVDSQVIYDLARGGYLNSDVITCTGVLNADANADGVVDSADAFVIQRWVCGLTD